MQITKIHTTGKDYIFCSGAGEDASSLARRLLDRRLGIGADGLILTREAEDGVTGLRLFSPDGAEVSASASALVAAAKFIYDGDNNKKIVPLRLGGVDYTVRMTVLGGRVICVWVDMPRIKPKPMEQLKYYHGIRGEVLRACMAHPRVSLYSLCGEHAVFLLESAVAVKRLAIHDVCTRLSEVLFYGEGIDLHFVGVSGENSLVMRSWRCGGCELASSGEGATLAAYAAYEGELLDTERIIVKTLGGSMCVDLDGQNASLCAKCETVFYGEAM